MIDFTTSPQPGNIYRVTDISTDTGIYAQKSVTINALDGFELYRQILPIGQSVIDVPVNISLWLQHLGLVQCFVTLNYSTTFGQNDAIQKGYYLPTLINTQLLS